MLAAAIIFSVVAATAAAEGPGTSANQQIQLGSIGSFSVHLSGVVAPVKVAAGDMPTYRFSSVVKGATLPEKEYLKCRCSAVDNFYVPLGARAATSVLLCKSVSYESGTAPLTEADKVAFLLYSSKLTKKAKKITLLLGKSAYQNFLASHASPAAALRAADPEEDRSPIESDAAVGKQQIYSVTSPSGFATIGVAGSPSSTGSAVFWTINPSPHEISAAPLATP